jgi:hypothetical protein
MHYRINFYLSLLFVVFCSNAISQSLYPTNYDYYTQLEERQKVISSAIASQAWKAGDDFRARIYLGITKIATGIDKQRGLELLQEAVDDSLHWGCFNVYSMMDGLLRVGDLLPPELFEKAKMRLCTHFGEDKGFTENHKLQYRTARYLFAQTWPNYDNFADGMSPTEAKNESENWINNWIDRTVTIGQMEYDSVNYMQLYLLCFNSLYDFTEDKLMKQKAWMMMQLLLADWATEYLNGNWIGGHSREKYNQVTHTILNCGVAIPLGYLYFGNAHFFPELPEMYFSGLSAIQGFRPLSILGSIATDRATPFIHMETKAPRRGFGINTSDLPIWKYDYVTKDYALCSTYGDLTAVENHRWDLTWVSELDGSICFFINPSFSRDQLLKYFDEDAKTILASILRQRPYYEDPNKWVEGSPYEKLLQHENTIIALYNIPKKERNQHVNGFYSKIISERIEEDGWIFCQTDSIYFAVKTLTKGKWFEEKDHFRLTLKHRKTGIIMEVAQVAEYESFDDFKSQIKSNPLNIDLNKLHVTYTTSTGNKLDFKYSDKRFVNQNEINFENWQLFDGPFIQGIKGSKIFKIQYKDEKVILDFNDFSVKIN